MMPDPSLSARSSPYVKVLAFVALTFLFSWAQWLAAQRGWLPLTPLGSFGPSIAAILLTAAWGGRAALRDFWRAGLRWRAPLRVYAVAVLAPPLLYALAALLAHGPAGLRPTGSTALPWWGMALVPLEILILGGPLGEEFGWRGFALPHLLERLHPIPASFAVAAIWFAWHLPLFWLPQSEQASIPMPIFAATLLAWSFLLTWIYDRSRGSVFLCILFHTSTNTAFWLFEQFLPRSLEGPAFSRCFLIVALGSAVAAAVALSRATGERFAGTGG
jgi:membrane protease YdiL (CAAX protease family)